MDFDLSIFYNLWVLDGSPWCIVLTVWSIVLTVVYSQYLMNIVYSYKLQPVYGLMIVYDQ